MSKDNGYIKQCMSHGKNTTFTRLIANTRENVQNMTGHAAGYVVLAAVATLAVEETYTRYLANLFFACFFICGRRVKGTSNNV